MTKQEIIEYNNRQIKLMENRIKLYTNHQLSIKNFIDDIDALLGQIQEPPSSWIKDIKGLLWEIEIIYAWALDQQDELTTEELQQISYFVNEIKELTLWYKKKHLPQKDDK